MNPKLVSLLFCLYLLWSCQNEEASLLCDLEQAGLLGKWEIQSLSIDGFTSLAIICCQFVEFQEDGQVENCRGNCINTDPQTIIAQGSFELNPKEQSIFFDTGSRQFTYTYQLQNDQLTFIYQEDGAEFVETWARVD